MSLALVLFCLVPSHTWGMISWGNVCANRGQVEKFLKIKACKHITPTLLWELTTSRSGYGVSEGHPLRVGTLVNFKCCITFSYLLQDFLFLHGQQLSLYTLSAASIFSLHSSLHFLGTDKDNLCNNQSFF